MWIISQHGNFMINTMAIYLDGRIIKADTEKMSVQAGEYITDERAKEVLEGIFKARQNCYTPVCYRMPKE